MKRPAVREIGGVSPSDSAGDVRWEAAREVRPITLTKSDADESLAEINIPRLGIDRLLRFDRD